MLGSPGEQGRQTHKEGDRLALLAATTGTADPVDVILWRAAKWGGQKRALCE